MATKKQLDELFKIARDSQQHGPKLCEILRNTVVPKDIQRVKPRYHKTRDEDFTGEDRERLHRLMNTPYGL